MTLTLPHVTLTPGEMMKSVWFKINTEPGTFDQKKWRIVPGQEDLYGRKRGPDCGTAYCVAGHVVVLDGGTFITDDPREYNYFLKPRGDDRGTDVTRVYDSRNEEYTKYIGVSAATRAARLLGLDGEDAAWLFSGDRTKEEIRDFYELKGGHELTTPGRNPFMLRTVMAVIEEHPEDWDQGFYWRPAEPGQHTCGGVGCFAGHTANLDGGKPIFLPDTHPAAGAWSDWWEARPGERLIERIPVQVRGDRDLVSGITTWNRAANVLGLAVNEAEFLFSGFHTLPVLRLLVDNLCSGKDIRDGYLDLRTRMDMGEDVS